MYAIVEWIGSDPPQVSAVPSNWLVTDDLGNLQSCWPSSSSDVLAFKQRREPGSKWKKYGVRQIGMADSYDQAIKRQQRAQMTSDLSADESLDDRATRHQRCRLEFSADEHEVQTKKRSKSSVTEVATALKTNPLPQVPLPPGLQCSGPPSLVQSSTIVSRTPSASSLGALLSPLLQPLCSHSQPQSTVMGVTSDSNSALVEGSASVVQSSPIVSSALSVSPVAALMSPPMITPLRSRPPSTALGGVTNHSNGALMQALQQLCRKVAETHEQVMFNTQLIQDMARKQHGIGKEKIGRLPSSCRLPLTTYDEVLEVEQKLKSKEFYSQLVAYLSLIGGATIKDFVSRTLTKLLHGVLAKKFVWAGRLTSKHAFMNLELKNVMVEATQKNPLTSKASEAEVENELKLWLRGAPDRNGGRSVRAKKAAKKILSSARSSHHRNPRSNATYREGNYHSRSSSSDSGRRYGSSVQVRASSSSVDGSSPGRRHHRSHSSSRDQGRHSHSSVQVRTSSPRVDKRRNSHSYDQNQAGSPGRQRHHRSHSSSRNQSRRSLSSLQDRASAPSVDGGRVSHSFGQNQSGSSGQRGNHRSRSSSLDQDCRSSSSVHDQAGHIVEQGHDSSFGLEQDQQE